MRVHRFLVIYRRENDPEVGVWKTVVDAVSKVEATKAFYRLMTNGSFIKVTFHVIEVLRVPESTLEIRTRNCWIKEAPSRPKCQTYVCPYCAERCYATSLGCNYRYCPHCGKEVIIYETTD